MLIDTLSEPAPRPAPTQPQEPSLLTETVVLAVLALLAAPVEAEPPKVLNEAVASPDVASWLLSLDTSTVLSLSTVAVRVVLTEALLFDNGPVSPMVTELAAATPRPRPKVAMPIAA